jgi:hypothetical protein
MQSKSIFLCILLFLSYFFAHCQTTVSQKIDKLLTNDFRKLISSDVFAPIFKEKLIKHLKKPITFTQKLDSLSQYLTISTSEDKKIKFYSWDDRTGGSWHNINCFAQFEGSNGKIIVQQLNTENELEFTDSAIYEIYKLIIKNKTYYLTLAWGTHGSGEEHRIIQVFSMSDDKLTKYKACFTNNNDLILHYGRTETLNLTFNPTTKIISYNKKEYDRKTKSQKIKTIRLKLFAGVFRLISRE